MMSLHHLCSEDFMTLIIRHEWEQAKVEIKRDRVTAQKSALLQGFLGCKGDCQVTPMHVACAHNAPLDFLEVLHGLDKRYLRSRDSVYKRLPLHVALMSSAHPRTVLQLIHWDSTAAQGKDMLGRYPLHYACNHGASVEEIEHLIRAYPQAVTMADSNGWLPIHVACRFDMSLAVIRMLLKIYPTSIHLKTSKGTTPLTYARRTKDQALITYLQNLTHSIPAPDNDIDHASIHLEELGIEVKEPIHSANFLDLSTTQLHNNVSLPEIRPRMGTSSASSVTSSLTNSPTVSRSSSAHALETTRDEQMARLAFSPRTSPYTKTTDKHVRRLPFLGERIDVDIDF